jgi:hypothetical protein
MKKKYLIIVLFLIFAKSYGQEPIQEAYVSRTLLNFEEGWIEKNYSKMVNISSNRKGQLKIDNAEFLTELSGGKAKMLESSAYTTAVFMDQILTKEKEDKNGLLNITYEGVLIFKTFEGMYKPNAKVTFIINKADVIGIKIYNKDSSLEYLFSLEIKD